MVTFCESTGTEMYHSPDILSLSHSLSVFNLDTLVEMYVTVCLAIYFYGQEV